MRAEQIYDCLLAAARKGECAPTYRELAALIEYPCDEKQAKSAMEYLRRHGQIASAGRNKPITFPAHPGIATAADHWNVRLAKYRDRVTEALRTQTPLDQIAKQLKCGRRIVAEIYQSLVKAGAIPPRPRPTSRIAEWRKRLKTTNRPLTDTELYGDLAPAITTLRKARFGVCRAETVGKPRGMWVVGQMLVTPDRLREMAARFASGA